MRRNDVRSVLHQIRILEAQKALYQQNYDESQNRYVELCLAQGLPPGPPAKIPSYTLKSNRLLFGIWSSAVLATFVFGILNAISIEAASGLVVFFFSVLFAVLMGYFVSCVLARWLDVDIAEPESIRTADILLIASGVVSIVSFVVFLALRFWESSTARGSLPILATFFELGLLTALASMREVLPVYSWPEEYAKKCDFALRKIVILDQRTAACKKYLTGEDEKNDRKNDDRDVATGPRAASASDVPRKRPKPNGSATDHPDLD